MRSMKREASGTFYSVAGGLGVPQIVAHTEKDRRFSFAHGISPGHVHAKDIIAFCFINALGGGL